jgi:hypothetical protein
MYQLKPDLSAEYILKQYSQEQIMEHYLGVPIKLRTRFLSPLREDNNPTCGFFYTKEGSLIFKDFGGFFSGGCFKVVMHIYSCSFYEALEIIANDFGLIDGVRVERKDYPHYIAFNRPTTTIEIQRRPFNDEDREFWTAFGITKKTLLYFHVPPVQRVWLNGRAIYSYKEGDPAYAYDFGDGRFKIYFPKRSTSRFMCNCSVVQGYQVDRDLSKTVVITKSMKDVMVLHEFGITAVAPQSETVYPEESWVNELLNTAQTVVSLYDFDRAGVTMANFMRKKYGIQPYFLTNGRFGSVNYQAKDISDLVKFVGKIKAAALIEQVNDTLGNHQDSTVHHPRKDEQLSQTQVLSELRENT